MLRYLFQQCQPPKHPMTTVLFDIDGTLIQTGGAGKIAFAETFRELFGIE